MPTDPYGNLGEVADPSWIERWMGWSRAVQDEYMAGMAAVPVLSESQMGEIIQGLPPTPSTWMTPMTRLSEYASVLDRLSQDVQRGVISIAPTPDEFAAWCDQFGVELPDSFVQGLATAASDRVTLSICAQSPISIALPKWLPLPMDGQKSAPVKKPRGRPPVAIHKYEQMLTASRKIHLAAARNGETMTIAQVATDVAGSPDGCGMTKENIERRLKGKLYLDQTRAIAASAKRTKKQLRARLMS